MWRWVKNGWRKSSGDQIPHCEVWQSVYQLEADNIKVEWIARSSESGNIEADRLAKAGCHRN